MTFYLPGEVPVYSATTTSSTFSNIRLFHWTGEETLDALNRAAQRLTDPEIPGHRVFCLMEADGLHVLANYLEGRTNIVTRHNVFYREGPIGPGHWIALCDYGGSNKNFLQTWHDSYVSAGALTIGDEV